MKDMIYYPGFETRDENWLKFALLYFDTLRPIIPYTSYSEKRYLSDTFQYVMGEADLIKPYRPKYPEGLRASTLACEEFEKFLLHPERYGSYFIEANLEHLLKNGKIKIIKIVHFLVKSIRKYFLIFVFLIILQHRAEREFAFQMTWRLCI